LLEIKKQIIEKCKHGHWVAKIKISQVLKILLNYWEKRIAEILENMRKKIKLG
jgi:hypothetical protein